MGQGGCLLGGSCGRVGPRANRCLKRLRAGPARAQPVTRPPQSPPGRYGVGIWSSRKSRSLPNPTASRMRAAPWELPRSRCVESRLQNCARFKDVMTEVSIAAALAKGCVVTFLPPGHSLSGIADGIRSKWSSVEQGSGHERPNLGQSQEYLSLPIWVSVGKLLNHSELCLLSV